MLLRNVLLAMCVIGSQTTPTDANEAFPVTPSMAIVVEPADPRVRAVGEYLAERLRLGTGYTMSVEPGDAAAAPEGAILLTTVDADASLGPEGYELTVTPTAAILRAPEPRGLFRGVQTVRQLLPPGFEKPEARNAPDAEGFTLPCVHITDKPRYPWRGMLLDCCRHFMTKDFVKRYIDLLAYHRMNVLHWHATEDQGWRIEIKKYPRLSEIGAWRGEGNERHGGFYTQEDIKEIVAYAAARYVTVVPEIEMPGHSMAALASYPELSCTGGPFEVSTKWGIREDVYCAGSERTFEFLEDVLSEVIELFPSEFIHVGGDECPKTRWEKCAKCQARIKAEGLADEHELQSYFIRRIERFLNGKGRRLIGWDEILEGGLAPNATVQSWRGMSGAVAAAKSGHDVIVSPTSHCYLDYAQARRPGEPTRMGFIDLETAYSLEPTPPELTPDEARHVLGAEGNMWTEHAPQERVDHQVFPRLCALAEVTWSPADARDWKDFSERMKTHCRRLDALGVTYYLEPPRCVSANTVFSESAEVAMENPLGRGEIRYTLDGSEPSEQSTRYTSPLQLTESTVVKVRTFLDDDRSTETMEYRFVKQQPREPVKVAGLAPGLAYEYYEGDWQRLPDFDRLTPVASGAAATADLAVRKRDDGFAVRFTGYIRVPANGVYAFYLTSDDGSRLWIGDDLVVDHDGLHSTCEQRGQIILEAGTHPITIAAFEAGGAQHLQVEYSGPGIARKPIPEGALCRRGD